MTKRTAPPFKKGDLVTLILETVTAFNRAIVATTDKVFKVISVRLHRKGWIVNVTGRLRFLAKYLRKLEAPPRHCKPNKIFRAPCPA